MDFVTVSTSLNPAEAELVRSRLDARGIQASILHENAPLATDGYALATGGVKIQVPVEQEQAAREILES